LNPLNTMYGLAVNAKNQLYDRGFLRTQRLRGPVVSVGNLSTGGSGKTPFVILLGEHLRKCGVKFDVLSRGYGRETHGVFEVDRKGSPLQFGDEPLLIRTRVECPVMVSEDRHQAGIFAEQKFGPQLHILDDGFQHRRLARDIDIVLLAPEDFQDSLLPGGRLREPLSSLRRADEVIVMGDGEAPAQFGQTAKQIRRTVLIENAPQRPVVFCGIAKPKRFVEQLRSQGIKPAAERFFRDHHFYREADLGQLKRLRGECSADGFITTEKDAINLGDRISQLENVAVARVSLLAEPADALDTLLRQIADLGRLA
jgi:tetraacyldisaccharide 4'-kinase